MNARVHFRAMPAPATATAEEIRVVNARYHDGAAADYDAKWGIDLRRSRAPRRCWARSPRRWAAMRRYERSLEIGAGTGYFSLNMLQAGVVDDAVCTDISPGMLDALQRERRAPRTLDVATVACDAEELPFEDASFDLVFGHAVLHHLPDLDRAFARVPPRPAPGRRAVLRRRAVALRRPHRQRPQARRDRASRRSGGGCCAPRPPPRATATAARPTISSRRSSTSTPSPRTQLAVLARRAGLRDVHVRGEELLANWFGWANRALEATADPDTVPWALEGLRLQGLPGLPARSIGGCSSRACRRPSSTT